MRNSVKLVIAAGVAALAGLLIWWQTQPEPKPAMEAPAPQAEVAPAPAPAAQPEEKAAPAEEPAKETAKPATPSFDVVRVSPEGQAVIAGRAAPRQEVEILLDGKTIGTAEADAEGSFATVLDIPPSGEARALTLRVALGETSGDVVALAPSAPAADEATAAEKAAAAEQAAAEAAAAKAAAEQAAAEQAAAEAAAKAEAEAAAAERAAAEAAAAQAAAERAAAEQAAAEKEAAEKAAAAAAEKAAAEAAAVTRPAPEPPSAEPATGSAADTPVDEVAAVGSEATEQAAAEATARAAAEQASAEKEAAEKAAAEQAAAEAAAEKAAAEAAARAAKAKAAAEAAAKAAEAKAAAEAAAKAAAEKAAAEAAAKAAAAAAEPGAGNVEPDVSRVAVSTPVVILPQDDTGQAPLLVKPGAEDVELLQPAPVESGAGMVLDRITYSEDGALIAAGRGRPGAVVRVYVNAEFIEEVRCSETGDWRVEVAPDVAAAAQLLRFDEVDSDGKVVSRLETPFEYSPAAATQELRQRKIVVQKGDYLWKFAEQYYGEGWRYSVIFSANSNLIRDPDLIYPGQVFTIPELVNSQ